MALSKYATQILTAGTLALGLAPAAEAQNLNQRDIGEVDTVYRFMGANDSIKIVAFNDPEVEGVTCWLSRPITGGLSGGLGIAEDKSDASIACRQTGPIVVTGDLERDQDGEEVFNEKRSVWFKELHVSRFFDEAASTMVYLTWSDKLIDGSPKNSLSTVVAMPWLENDGTVKPAQLTR